MQRSILWLMCLLLVVPLTGMSKTTSDACMANSQASLDAIVQGDYAAAGKDFSTATAKALPSAKLGQTWAEVQRMFGAYRNHAAPNRKNFQGEPVVVTRVTFANTPLDFVVGCDASDRITMFYLLKPSVVEAPAPIEARISADGVRVEYLRRMGRCAVR